MKVCIVGAGAMGGSLAAHAASAGYDVVVVDRDPTVVARVNEAGMTVSTTDAELVARVRAVSSAAEIGIQDVVFLFVKAGATRAAAVDARAVVGPNTAVVTLQNGWGNAEIIADVLGVGPPHQQLVMGVTYNSCTTVAPATVNHSAKGGTIVGPYVDGSSLETSEVVASLLRSSGWTADASADVKSAVWSKLILNAATLAPAALSRLSAGAILELPEMTRLVHDLASEACAVATRLGYVVDEAERQSRIVEVLRLAGSGRPSMLQDVAAARKTEVEVINGAVVAAADDVGVQVPLNRAMIALIHGLEESYSR